MEKKVIIQNYINRTNISEKDSEKYHMNLEEIRLMYEMICSGDIWSALILTFEYGRAKGYRLANRRVHHG